MSISYYPEQLKAVLTYIAALNAAEKEIGADARMGILTPYPKAIQLEDADGTDYGILRDEIGGEWSWSPPASPTPQASPHDLITNEELSALVKELSVLPRTNDEPLLTSFNKLLAELERRQGRG